MTVTKITSNVAPGANPEDKVAEIVAAISAISSTSTPDYEPWIAFETRLRTLAKRFDFPGGRIKNAILKASYLAAQAGTEVTQGLLVKASLEEASAAGTASRDPSIVDAQRMARILEFQSQIPPAGGPRSDED